ncbi:TPA: hypothetical protein ACOAUS_001154 [Enterococcus faecium]
METDCSLLAIDFRIQQGIEQEHLDNRDIYFLDYVSTLKIDISLNHTEDRSSACSVLLS